MGEQQIIVRLNPDVPPTGSDLGVVNAARRSFGKRSSYEITNEKTNLWVMSQGDVTPTYLKLKDKDKRLLEFLARGMTADDFDRFLESIDIAVLEDDCGSVGHGKLLVEKLWQWRNTPTHDTPFNHGFFSFEVKTPIFVRAQLVKHEYLIMSEFSRRYITDDVEFYEPDYWRKAAKDKKQGSLEEPVTLAGGPWGKGIYNGSVEKSLQSYKDMIEAGVAPEQARMVLPQSLMTAWTWSGTLGAFANMCKLRIHPEAQYESRLVAEKVYEELKKQFPVSAPLLVEGVR